MTRAATEEYQRAAFGLPQPRNWGASGAAPQPDAGVIETQVWTLTANATVAAPLNPRAVGDQLFLVFVQDATGGRSISWNGIYRNAPTPSVGIAGQRLSAEFRWDSQSWQFTGGSTAFA